MSESLLDDRRLNGEHAVWCDVGCELNAFLVARDDLDDAVSTIKSFAQAWGGGSSVLVPVEPGVGIDQHPAWSVLLEFGTVDDVVARGHLDTSTFLERVNGLRLVGHDNFEPVWSVLHSAAAQAGDKLSVRSALPAPDDPWFIAYLGSFGSAPDTPSGWLLRRAGLREDLGLADLVDLREEFVADPSSADLVARVRDRTSLSPRMMSMYRLAFGQAPWSQDFARAPTWTERGWTRNFVGSNVAVIYEPGSVPDLCLLWNLRASHGFPDRLPLALPNSDNVGSDLRAWVDPESYVFAGRLRGVGRPFAVTSLSIPIPELEAIAEDAGVPWRAVAPDELIQAAHRPAMRTGRTVTFRDGTANVEAFGADVSDFLRRRPRAAFGAQLKIRVSLQRKPLPALRSLRGGDAPLAWAWRDGGFDFQLPSAGTSVQICWPSGWTVLRAAVQDRGFDIRASRPGKAAEALLRRLGSVEQLDPLRDPWILDTLDRLAHRRGLTWFRDRARSMADRAAHSTSDADGGASALARIEDYLQALTLTARDDEQDDLTFSALSQRLGARNAHAWLEWAESTGLLVRGVSVRCGACGAVGWRTVAELAPPVACAGCGVSIDRPYAADHLVFRYRATTLLLEVMAADALPHLLCHGWWSALLRHGLYGAHPGVEVLDDAGNVLGEADVVLLLHDGSLAIGEVKRRANGLTQSEVEKLERLADLLNADWTFYATPGLHPTQRHRSGI